MVKEKGVIAAIEGIVTRPLETRAYRILTEMGLEDKTFEAVVLFDIPQSSALRLSVRANGGYEKRASTRHLSVFRRYADCQRIVRPESRSHLWPGPQAESSNMV